MWTHRIIGTGIVLVVGLAAPVAAQERPAVFVHGLGSSPGTWQGAADRLRGSLNISTYVPGVPWAEHFETQAGSLQAQLSMLPANTIAIGHSNGGIASRQWSAHRPIGGVITVGSPQQGAPLVNNALALLGFHQSLYTLAGAAFASMGAQPNEWWDVYVYVQAALALAQSTGAQALYKLAGLGVLSQYPVLPQMAVGSGFLAHLNSAANLARESSAIPARVGIAYELDRYWLGGPFRLDGAQSGDLWHARIWASVATLEFAGAYLMTNHSTNGTAMYIAARLYDVAGYLRFVEPGWCWAVTNDGSCWTPHDGVVPVWSQTYPGAHNLYVHGPSHVQETQVSDSVLSYALSTQMQVTPRGTGGGGGGGGGGEGGGGSDELQAGESLQPGESRTSSNGEYTLYYQGDGNLVLYRNSTGQPLWWTGTSGPAGETAMQGDGNLVVYNAAGQAQWWSGTVGYGGARLAVQSDGNLVIYDAYGYPIWARQ
jgi:pimeloyl-ACP methyl ester carboxylesterase